MFLLASKQQGSCCSPCSPFSSHICDDLGDRRDVLLQEIASYLLLQNDLVNHQFEATRSIHPSIHRSLSVRVRLRVCVCVRVCVSE